MAQLPLHDAAPTLSPDRQTGGHGGTLAALTFLFFAWGFVSCLNDILIPLLKGVFGLGYAQAMLVQFCFFGAYFLVSLPAGWLVGKIGFRGGLVAGLVVAGTGACLFYPAAAFISYPFFLGALFVLAAGITILQVAANPYVAALGSPRTASSRLNLTQAFNALGTTVAPLAGTWLILSRVSGRSPAEAVQLPYVMLGGILFALAGVVALLRFPSLTGTAPAEGGRGGSGRSAWQYPHLVLGALAIFLYVGAEVSIGSFLISFLGQPHVAALSPAAAGHYVSFYWGGAMIGRFVGALLLRRVAAPRLLTFNAGAAIFLVLLAMFTSGATAMWSLIAVGLFNSIMFATIFTLAIEGLGVRTSQGSGILCAAIVGGALLPLLQGLVADRVGVQLSFLTNTGCYAYILFYGYKGYLRREAVF